MLLSAEGAAPEKSGDRRIERSGALGIGHTMRPGSEGAPKSTLEMEPRATHLPLLQSVSLGWRHLLRGRNFALGGACDYFYATRDRAVMGWR